MTLRSKANIVERLQEDKVDNLFSAFCVCFAGESVTLRSKVNVVKDIYFQLYFCIFCIVK